MKATKKLLALMISVALVVGGLVSCNLVNPPKTDTRDVDIYTATVDIRFATTDNKMKAAIDGLSSTATILKKGEDISVSTHSESEGASVDSLYLLTAGMLFNTLSVKVGEHSVDEHKMSYVDETEFDSIISSIGQGASIGKDDFAIVSTRDNGYSCAEILDESRESLIKIVSKRFAALGATVELNGVSLDVTADGEFIESSVLSCDYVITLEGERYSVTMRLYTEYDYTADVVIAIPDDAGKYEPASLDEILG